MAVRSDPWRAAVSTVRPHVAVWAAAATSVTVVILHYLALDRVPPGFFIDEAGVSYAAQGIALDGRDEHGAAWPLYFQAFGEWKNPIVIYAIAGAFRLFGPSVVAARAVPTTFALLTAVLLGLLAWRISRSRWLAWGTFAVAAITPWLFTVGRMAFEVAALPTLLALFLLLWHRAQSDDDWRWAVRGGVALGLAAYAYSTARLFVPLLLVALVVAELSLSRWRLLVAIAVTVGAMMFPILLFNAEHPGSLLARYQLISVFADSHSRWESIARVWRTYTSAFSPSLLFMQALWIQGGEFFLALAPLLAAGVVGLWRRRRDPYFRFVALGLVLAPVPAALTYDFSHELRNMEAVPFFAVVMVLGVMELAPLLTRQRALAAAMAAVLGLQAVSYLSDYFTRTPERMSGWQQEGLQQAVRDAQAASGGMAPVVVSSHVFSGDFMYAFYSGEDVRTYRARGVTGATYRPLDGPLPPATVVLTMPDEKVPLAEVIEEVKVTHPDSWGRPDSRVVYRLWRTAGAQGPPVRQPSTPHSGESGIGSLPTGS